MADLLIPYLSKMRLTHADTLPITYYPNDLSCQYQVLVIMLLILDMDIQMNLLFLLKRCIKQVLVLF